ncbi:hypothetical protein [Helicobacter trogontum]|nr:hypothetical protein [Helicobacter trogontum]
MIVALAGSLVLAKIVGLESYLRLDIESLKRAFLSDKPRKCKIAFHA